MAQPPLERVVLLGFMGSGKTTVGRRLAALLGWPHVDLDHEIEREQGRAIAEIFRAEGEPRFRRLEIETSRRLFARREAVITPGGGWVTNRELLPLLRAPGTLSVWLRVSPAEVLRRLRADLEVRSRPMLSGDDLGLTVGRLLREREPLYAHAELVVPTDGRGADDIAKEIATIVRSRAAAPPSS